MDLNLTVDTVRGVDAPPGLGRDATNGVAHGQHVAARGLIGVVAGHAFPMPTPTSPEPDRGGADQPGGPPALLGELTTAHQGAHDLAARLATEVADCDDRLVETRTILDAVVRHATDAIAVIDRDLRVHFASAAAVELLADATPTSSSLSLLPVLPPGGAAEARRYLVPEPPGDWRNPPVPTGPMPSSSRVGCCMSPSSGPA